MNLEENVQRGIKALEGIEFDWVAIDLAKLDMADPSCCVLGQGFIAGYSYGLEFLEIPDRASDDYGFSADYHGFDSIAMELTYEELDELWSEAIAERQS